MAAFLNKMKLNTSKSSLMWFIPKQSSCAPHPPVFVDNHQLQEVEEQKALIGIMFDSKLQWRSQINYIYVKRFHII